MDIAHLCVWKTFIHRTMNCPLINQMFDFFSYRVSLGSEWVNFVFMNNAPEYRIRTFVDGLIGIFFRFVPCGFIFSSKGQLKLFFDVYIS